VSYITNAFFIIPVGVIAGVLLAMPIGPVNLLGLQRAVERGFLGGLAAGLGILLGDGLIALLAALGVNAVSGAIREYRSAIQILGGLGLLGAGVQLYLRPVSLSTHVETTKARLRDYAWDIPEMFLLTVSNPGSVLALLAIYAGVCTFVGVETVPDALTVVAAISGGIFLYWFVVSQWIAGARHRLDKVQLGRINHLAGLVLIGFGVLLIGEILLRWLVLWAIGQLFGSC
jgi:threonine/homoserine/homoserine lactone efflux protein